MRTRERKPQRVGKIAFYSSVAMVIAGMAISELSGNLAHQAKSRTRSLFYKQSPIPDSIAGNGRTFELAVEAREISLSAPKIGRLSGETIDRMYDYSMLVKYVDNKGDTIYSCEISDIPYGKSWYTDMTKRALEVLDIPCEVSSSEPPGRAQAAPYPSWKAFAEGNTRYLVFKESQPANRAYAAYPDVFLSANMAAGSTADFVNLLLHETGHNFYYATMGEMNESNRANERLAASIYFAFAESHSFYGGDSISSNVEALKWSEAEYTLTYSAPGAVAREMLSLAERKIAKPYEKSEAAGQWMVALGAIAMLASFIFMKIRGARES